MEFETLRYDVADDHVATITIDRPEALNAFNQRMCEEFREVWARVRDDDAVHVVVLCAAGDRAFSAGVDRKQGYVSPKNVWNEDEFPITWLLPKLNRVWKPVICAVHGLMVGGALYWLNDSDIVICSSEAQFSDPHVSIGSVSARVVASLARRIPFTEAMRISLMGNDELLSAERAFQIGLVSEVVTKAELHGRAHEIAGAIAAKPPAAVQGTVKAAWESLDMPLSMAWRNVPAYTAIGNAVAKAQMDAMEAPAGRRPPAVR